MSVEARLFLLKLLTSMYFFQVKEKYFVFKEYDFLGNLGTCMSLKGLVTRGFVHLHLGGRLVSLPFNWLHPFIYYKLELYCSERNARSPSVWIWARRLNRWLKSYNVCKQKFSTVPIIWTAGIASWHYLFGHQWSSCSSFLLHSLLYWF